MMPHLNKLRLGIRNKDSYNIFKINNHIITKTVPVMTMNNPIITNNNNNSSFSNIFSIYIRPDLFANF